MARQPSGLPVLNFRGMGLGFVLALWLGVGLICSFVLSLLARSLALRLTRHSPDTPAKRRLIRSSRLLPFVCLVWAGGVVIMHGVIDETVFHRDFGLGDDAYVPLIRGWSLILDDSGTGVLRYADGYPGGEILGVSSLQIADPWILGAADSQWFGRFPESQAAPDRFFLLNTASGARREFGSEAALRSAASQAGITLKLDPVVSTYTRIRFTWFDGLTLFLLFAPPLGTAAWLLRLLLGLRHSGPISTPAEA
jgi:hypothetical protein